MRACAENVFDVSCIALTSENAVEMLAEALRTFISKQR